MKFKVRTDKGVYEVEAASQEHARTKVQDRGHTVREITPLDPLPPEQHEPLATASLHEPAYQNDPGRAALAEEVRHIGAQLKVLLEITAQPRWYEQQKTYFKVQREAVAWGILIGMTGVLVIGMALMFVLAGLGGMAG